MRKSTIAAYTLVILILVLMGMWLFEERIQGLRGTVDGSLAQLQESDLSKAQRVEEGIVAIGQLSEQVRSLIPKQAGLAQKSPLLPLYDLLISAQEALISGQKFLSLTEYQDDLVRLIVAGRYDVLIPLLESIQREFAHLSTEGHKARTALDDLPSVLHSQLPSHVLEQAELGIEFLEYGGAFVAEDLSALLVMLGRPDPHLTAVLFQNSSELRATGGFIGSLALVPANDGHVEYQFRDVYALAWNNGSTLPPPEGFERLVKRLNLRDANSFRDLRLSSEQMIRMFERSDTDTPDTLIYITDSLLWDLIFLVGGVDLPNTEEYLYDRDLAPLIVSFFVEGRHFAADRTNPKALLPQLLPQLIEKLRTQDPIHIWDILMQARRSRAVQVYSRNPIIQTAAEKWRIDGQLRRYDTDDQIVYVTANVGGNKSDPYVEESLSLDTAVGDDTFRDTLTITRTMTIDERREKKFLDLLDKYGSGKLEPELLRDTLLPEANASYVHLYIPKEATDIEVLGIGQSQINQVTEGEFLRLGFRYPLLRVGQSESVTLSYDLPRIDDDHDLYLVSQAGKRPYSFRWVVYDTESADAQQQETLIRTDTYLTTP